MAVVDRSIDRRLAPRTAVTLCIAALFLLPALPGAAAERDPGPSLIVDELHVGYRMVDSREPDGPMTWGASPIMFIDSGDRDREVLLPLPFPVFGGCTESTVDIDHSDGYLEFPLCGSTLNFGGSRCRCDFEWELYIGLDSRSVAANVFVFEDWSISTGAYVTFAVDGTIEVHLFDEYGIASAWWEWHSVPYGRVAMEWQDEDWEGSARWDPYSTLESVAAITGPWQERAEEQVDTVVENGLLIPGTSVPISPGTVTTPPIGGQSVGPVGVGSVPVGTPDHTVPKTCTPLSVLCVGPVNIPGQDLGQTPSVGPYGPFTTPGIPGQSVRVPVALEVGFTDIRTYVSKDVPAPGTWDGVTVVVPVPVIGDVPITVCGEGCPLPLLPVHEVYGSVFVRGTIHGIPVDVEVPFHVSGGSEA